MQCKFREIAFSEADVVNLSNWIPAGEFNPHNVRPWLLHDAGFVLAVVFASSLQDALDEAVDENKLDRFQIHPEDECDREDYMTSDFSGADAGLDQECPEYTDANGVKYWWRRTPAFLGNAGEPFDIENVDYVELPNPKRSFCAQFAAAQE